jgi:hypothetical protein
MTDNYKVTIVLEIETSNAPSKIEFYLRSHLKELERRKLLYKINVNKVTAEKQKVIS